MEITLNDTRLRIKNDMIHITQTDALTFAKTMIAISIEDWKDLNEFVYANIGS